MTNKYLHIFLALATGAALLGTTLSQAPSLDPGGRGAMGLVVMAVEFMVVAMVLLRVERFRTLPEPECG